MIKGFISDSEFLEMVSMRVIISSTPSETAGWVTINHTDFDLVASIPL